MRLRITQVIRCSSSFSSRYVVKRCSENPWNCRSVHQSYSSMVISGQVDHAMVQVIEEPAHMAAHMVRPVI